MEETSERRPVDTGADDLIRVELGVVAEPVIPTDDAERVFETPVPLKVPVGEVISLDFAPVLVGNRSDVIDPTIEVADAKSDVTPDTRDGSKPTGIVVDGDELEIPVVGPEIPAEVFTLKSVADDTPVVGTERPAGVVALKSVAGDAPVVGPEIPAEFFALKSVADDALVPGPIIPADDAEGEALVSPREVFEVGRMSDVTEDAADEIPPTNDESKSPEVEDAAAELMIGAIPVDGPVIPEGVLEADGIPVEAPVIPDTIVGAGLSVEAALIGELETPVGGPVMPAKLLSDKRIVAGPVITAVLEAEESDGEIALVI